MFKTLLDRLKLESTRQMEYQNTMNDFQDIEEDIKICPNCGSENCHYISSVSRSTSGFGFSRACCGTLLSGPVLGILCGLCGAGKTTLKVLMKNLLATV